MAISRTRLLYILAMLVSGIAVGLIVLARPAMRDAAFPPAAWPVLISLVFDIALGQAAARGKAVPLTMGDRFLGVIFAGLIVTVVLAYNS